MEGALLPLRADGVVGVTGWIGIRLVGEADLGGVMGEGDVELPLVFGLPPIGKVTRGCFPVVPVLTRDDATEETDDTDDSRECLACLRREGSWKV